MSSLPILLKPLPDEKAAEMELGIGRKTFYRELQKVEEDVRDIIEKVMEGGDSALLELTERFDHCRLSQIAVPEMEFQKSWDDVDPVFKRSIEVITAQIREFHSNQGQHSWWTFRGPSLLGEIVNPIDSIATYIPGGRAAYTSSVMMTVIPAQIAGVKHIQILTPPDSSGRVKREVLATAHFLGIHTVYRVGGAQAIAACTFGTETVPRVNKVVGPGNIYVTVAKKLLSGLVGIDSLAGPSEVLIIADETARPDWIALDLLAQAEHDPLSRAILLSQREDVLLAVKKVLEREIQNHPLSFEKKFPISLFQVENLDLAFRIANAIAPEHLEICCEGSIHHLPSLHHAGAIFFGNYAPVALGDYGYGPNHVLPTMGGSTFTSPLSVRDFLKTSSFIAPRTGDLSLCFSPYADLASREGLYYHQRSLLAREGKMVMSNEDQ